MTNPVTDSSKNYFGPPRTLEEWMNFINARLNSLEHGPQGIGGLGWNDAVIGPGFQVADSRAPGWRRTHDGRIELRGRLQKVSGAVNNNDVVMYLPYECAPPNNEQQVPSSVSVLGPATIGSGGSGVCRYDIQRESAWITEQLKDLQGNLVFDDKGQPVMIVVSKVEVKAKPGNNSSISGWVGFDNTVFDPLLYVDTLPAVPKGQEPLVPNPGIAVVQHPGGQVQFFTPGVMP